MPLSGCVCRLATAERGATEKQTLNNLENREGQHWGWGWGWRVFEGGGVTEDLRCQNDIVDLNVL